MEIDDRKKLLLTLEDRQYQKIKDWADELRISRVAVIRRLIDESDLATIPVFRHVTPPAETEEEPA